MNANINNDKIVYVDCMSCKLILCAVIYRIHSVRNRVLQYTHHYIYMCNM